MSGQDSPLTRVKLGGTVTRPDGNEPTPSKERLVWIVNNANGDRVLVPESKALGALQNIGARGVKWSRSV